MAHLRSFARAEAVDLRPLDLSLRLALIAMDIETELLKRAVREGERSRDEFMRRTESMEGWTP